jgi:hypothetical protein
MGKIHLGRRDYREEYLKSEHWKKKSREIRDRDKICRVCEKNSVDDVHHLSYDRLYDEREEDLVGVCRKCHNKIHSSRFLAKCSDLKSLKQRLEYSKKKFAIDKELIGRLNRSTINDKKKICGLLKVLNIEEFERLEGKKISYTKKIELEEILAHPWVMRDKPSKRRVRRF